MRRGEMSKVYCLKRCWVCGRVVSANGLAQTSHMRKHVREGYVTEDRVLPLWGDSGKYYPGYIRFNRIRGVETPLMAARKGGEK